jgi:hypothetical protein
MAKQKLEIVKRTYLGKVDVNEYFKVLIIERMNRN